LALELSSDTHVIEQQVVININQQIADDDYISGLRIESFSQ
jgi:hypothetical protein